MNRLLLLGICLLVIGIGKAYFTCKDMETNRQSLIELKFVLPEFNCQPDGNYAAKQCDADSCYCVEELTGKEIDGYRHFKWHSGEGNQCRCARELHEYRKLGIYGRSIDCTPKGDYKVRQCQVLPYCYCADPTTGQKLSEPVKGEMIDSLPCKDEEIPM